MRREIMLLGSMVTGVMKYEVKGKKKVKEGTIERSTREGEFRTHLQQKFNIQTN